ncbi:uncharacterized protein LOC128660490 [Bombina bombina]|uniref:uncharacterized protein LOC128660490 n=1 Tax=Bombina bombina TaxID=8345 RepID=UPI00235AA95A|nr:uncharacterized protein LOC128660490 [Bombina bombina]
MSLIDFIQDPVRTDPAVGLEYVIELRKTGSNWIILRCDLCDRKGFAEFMIKHIVSYEHIRNYLAKTNPTLLEVLSDKRLTTFKFINLLKENAKIIEYKEGVKKIKIEYISEDQYKEQYREIVGWKQKRDNTAQSNNNPKNIEPATLQSHLEHRPRRLDHRRRPNHLDQRPSHLDQRPSHFDQRPSHFDQRPSHFDHRPSHFDHRPSHFDHRPSHFDPWPSHFDPWPSHFDPWPSPFDPWQSHLDQRPSHLDQRPSENPKSLEVQQADFKNMSLLEFIENPARKNPLIGLDYVVEHKLVKSNKSVLKCNLCNCSGKVAKMINHLIGIPHIMKVLVKEHPSIIEDLEKKSLTLLVYNEQLTMHAKQIEATDGAKTIKFEYVYSDSPFDKLEVPWKPKGGASIVSDEKRKKVNDPSDQRPLALTYSENFKITSRAEASEVLNLTDQLSNLLNAFHVKTKGVDITDAYGSKTVQSTPKEKTNSVERIPLSPPKPRDMNNSSISSGFERPNLKPYWSTEKTSTSSEGLNSSQRSSGNPVIASSNFQPICDRFPQSSSYSGFENKERTRYEAEMAPVPSSSNTNNEGLKYNSGESSSQNTTMDTSYTPRSQSDGKSLVHNEMNTAKISIGEPPVLPLNEPPVKTVHGQLVKPLNESSVKPLNESSVKPLNESSVKPLNESSVKPLNESSVKPLDKTPVNSLGQPLSEPPVKPLSAPLGQPQSVTPLSVPLGQPQSVPPVKPLSAPLGQPQSVPPVNLLSVPPVTPLSAPLGQPPSVPPVRPLSAPIGQPLSMPPVKPPSAPLGQPQSVPPVKSLSTPLGQLQGVQSVKPLSAPLGPPQIVPPVKPINEPIRQQQGVPPVKTLSAPIGQPQSPTTVKMLRAPFVKPQSVPPVKPLGQPRSVPPVKPLSTPFKELQSVPPVRPVSAPIGQQLSGAPVKPLSAPFGQPQSVPPVKPHSAPLGQPLNVPPVKPVIEPPVKPLVPYPIESADSVTMSKSVAYSSTPSSSSTLFKTYSNSVPVSYMVGKAIKRPYPNYSSSSQPASKLLISDKKKTEPIPVKQPSREQSVACSMETSDLKVKSNADANKPPSSSSSGSNEKTSESNSPGTQPKSKGLSPDILKLLKGKDLDNVIKILTTLSPFYPALQDVNIEMFAQVLFHTGALD